MSAVKNYRNITNDPSVAATQKLPDQIQNNGGGFSYAVTDKSRLERFLILGVDGGTYYVSEQDLTKQNVEWLQKLIQKNSTLVLDTVFDVSVSGRAYRNSAALFVLAMVLNYGDDVAKSTVVQIAPQVARIATHVYELSQYIENLGGWGRAKRSAIAAWFTTKTPDQLAYQAVKYRQRNGWTLKDLMRLSHPVGVDKNVGNFILGKYQMKFSDYSPGMPKVVHGFMTMQNQTDLNGVLRTLDEYPDLPWETIPTQFLKDPKVWKTIFYNNSLNGQALLRNVTKMARIGAFNDLQFVGDYAKKLADKDMILKTRLHPVQYLLTDVTYNEGSMDRSNFGWGSSTRKKDWTTNSKIQDALQAGFKSSFATVVPSGKRFRIGVDVSGSMSWSTALGSDFTATQGSAAMALITASVEDNVEIVGFADSLRDLRINSNMSFAEAKKAVSMHNFGATNPGLLMNDSLRKRQEVDVFLVITDNEVNQGNHPSSALKGYREAMGINSKLVVMGMTATEMSIADPKDRGMLDVVGFDANAPKIVSEFAKGNI